MKSLLTIHLAVLLVIGALRAHAAAFTAVAPMATARNDHTATLLPNGKVLVVGGHDYNGESFNTCELFDPVTGAWSPAGALITARYNHSATLLQNGKVLVAGGIGPAIKHLASSELYDPGANKWTAVGNLSVPRANHKALLLASGKVVVVGGFGDTPSSLATAEMFDPASNQWSAAGNFGSLTAFTATLLASGKILVAGGLSQIDVDEPNTYLYDPATNAFTAAAKLFKGRRNHTATLLPDGQVLVAGGHRETELISPTTELYNPTANTWTASGSINTEREYHTETLLQSGKVLVVGGSNFYEFFISAAELYDPAAGTWSRAGNLLTARYFHTATLLQNGKLLIAGGIQFDGTKTYGLSSVELYDPAAPAFVSGPIAAPNPATTKDTVSFFTDATSAAGAVTYAWDFGDGTKASGEDVTHKYAAEGVYNATATITDPNGGTDSATVAVTVGAGNGAPQLTVSKASVKLGFDFGNEGKDTIAFSGTVTVPAGFNPDGVVGEFNVAGVRHILTFDAKGSAVDGHIKAKLSIKGTTAIYTFNSGGHGDYGGLMKRFGFTNTDTSKAQLVTTFEVILGAQKLHAVRTLIYSAKKDKSGSAK